MVHSHSGSYSAFGEHTVVDYIYKFNLISILLPVVETHHRDDCFFRTSLFVYYYRSTKRSTIRKLPAMILLGENPIPIVYQ